MTWLACCASIANFSDPITNVQRRSCRWSGAVGIASDVAADGAPTYTCDSMSQSSREHLDSMGATGRARRALDGLHDRDARVLLSAGSAAGSGRTWYGFPVPPLDESPYVVCCLAPGPRGWTAHRGCCDLRCMVHPRTNKGSSPAQALVDPTSALAAGRARATASIVGRLRRVDARLELTYFVRVQFMDCGSKV